MRAQKLAISALAELIFYRLGSEPAIKKKKKKKHTHTHTHDNQQDEPRPTAAKSWRRRSPTQHAKAASYWGSARCR
jgi:hypothetical protein